MGEPRPTADVASIGAPDGVVTLEGAGAARSGR